MNILGFCAVNPQRRFAVAEASIRAVKGLEALVFDDGDDQRVPWYTRVLNKYRRARELCLLGGYDALLTLESDMVVPTDAAERLQEALAQHDAQVAYGLYCWRHGDAAWNSYVALDEDAGFSLSDSFIRDGAANEWRAAIENVPFRSWGVGFGCTLIRRETLDLLEFRNFVGEHSFYVDWLFAADCNARHIKQVCDPRVKCGHIADGNRVLYPDLRQEKLYRSDILTGG